MTEGRFRYKCRNCGETYLGGAASVHFRTQLHLVQLVLTKIDSKGQEPGLMEIHNCKHGTEGVADLIGLIKVYHPTVGDKVTVYTKEGAKCKVGILKQYSEDMYVVEGENFDPKGEHGFKLELNED